jgi:hypothetical protein
MDIIRYSLWKQPLLASEEYTKVLGKFACRVCSKILGIGLAERSWGDVKHLKTNKRSHLSHDSIKKQATIYGAYCMEKASIYGKMAAEKENQGPIRFWTDEDFDEEFNMFKDDERNKDKNKVIRFFKGWEEEWEQAAILNKDPVNEAKLLSKYGGLQFFDEDTEGMLQIESEHLDWRRRRKDTGGYVLICYPEHYDKDSPNAKDAIEYWAFVDDLRYSICEYYKKNEKLGVQVLEQPGTNEEENDSSSSDDEENKVDSQEEQYH